MQPLLGADIRQVAQQIHWKPPGVSHRTGYRFHQDMRFRERRDVYTDLMTSYINTGLAIDPATTRNGCLQVFRAATSSVTWVCPTTPAVPP